MRRKSESSGILSRGSACLSCRRRKLKCTGTRPVCEQCSQMNRVHECTYDDTSKRSRTQQLREKVVVLEAKLRTLESESSCTPPGMSPISSDSSGDSLLEHCPEPSLSAEMHNTLIQTFIRHHRQCCFYTNTSRFDSSSSATIFQRSPPNPSLMSAIYLLGSFFSHIPVPHELQTQLLEQALRNITRSLHNQEHLMDVVQASCLIAQYFFFTHRVMEGNRHLLAAKRMAFDLGLYSVEPDVSTLSGYAYDPVLQDTREKAAVFWQVFMVDKFWSVTNHSDVTLPDRSPYQYSTTPLPVKEGVSLDVSAMNSPIYTLFDDHFQVDSSSLSTVAFKAIASSIFDRSLRVHNSWPRDGGVWAFHVSAEVALRQLASWVDPFPGRGSSVSKEPYFDSDLYTIHTLILTSTIHLHFDNISFKISNAAHELLELINFLNQGDYCYLDPILATCWHSVIVSFQRMMNITTGSNREDSIVPYANAFLRQGIDTLLIALRSMSHYVSLAGSLVRDLDLEDRRMAPIIAPRYSKELHVISDLERYHCTVVH